MPKKSFAQEVKSWSGTGEIYYGFGKMQLRKVCSNNNFPPSKNKEYVHFQVLRNHITVHKEHISFEVSARTLRSALRKAGVI